MLRTQVDEAMSQLLAVTQHLQAQAAENESIRREIVELQRQLSQVMTAQQA